MEEQGDEEEEEETEGERKEEEEEELAREVEEEEVEEEEEEEEEETEPNMAYMENMDNEDYEIWSTRASLDDRFSIFEVGRLLADLIYLFILFFFIVDKFRPIPLSKCFDPRKKHSKYNI
jgi:hypothetical protein